MGEPFELSGVRVIAVQAAAIGSQPDIAIGPFTNTQQFVMAKAIGRTAVPVVNKHVESFAVQIDTAVVCAGK